MIIHIIHHIIDIICHIIDIIHHIIDIIGHIIDIIDDITDIIDDIIDIIDDITDIIDDIIIISIFKYLPEVCCCLLKWSCCSNVRWITRIMISLRDKMKSYILFI